jgi:hypothetical protein
MNKLWIIIKSLKLGQNNEGNNKFYLSGGETFKLGRVVMKVIEVNTEIQQSNSPSEAESRETNTESELELRDGIAI